MFESFRLEENYTIKGTGFNLKMGAIYRVTDWMRLGIAVHSPSFYNINDQYDSEMFATNDTGRTFQYSSPHGEYDYNITTPFRAIGSLAFIIGKQGLISADYEFVDYSDAYLDSEFESYIDANNAIENNFTAASNLRVGGEIKLDPFSLRGGAAYYASPYVSGFNTDASRMSYSAGFGIKENGYFLDFAYVLTKYSENYYLYDRSFNVEPAKLDLTSSHFAVTFGVTF
jgi:long-subunit fatty acid transport protein